MSHSNEQWMNYALELAQKGWGHTNPNPLVGCVIIKNNKVIAEGYHAAVGQYHAERAAISEAKHFGISLAGSTLYVNLEPCAHYGRTPPCADLIIDSGIKKVVIAMEDPNPKVAGKGIDKLRQAGISVLVGVCEQEARKLNEIFIKYITTQIPFVLMKTAMSLDGKIAANSGDAKWISGEQSRAIVHHWRDRVAGILVGKNTVEIDDPSLTTRIPNRPVNNPARIIVDSSGSLSPDSRVFLRLDPAQVIFATTSMLSKEKHAILSSRGIDVIQVEDQQGRVDLWALLRYLGQQGIDSIMLEGGGRLNESFLKAGLIDKIMLFVAPKIIGGAEAVSCFYGDGIEKMSDAIKINDLNVTSCGSDLLIEGYPEYSKGD